MFRRALLLFVCCSFCSPLTAAPPWRAAFRAQRDQMRAQLEYQQATMNVPKQVYQQQKRVLKQQEKYLRDGYRNGVQQPLSYQPGISGYAQPGNPNSYPGQPPRYAVPPTRVAPHPSSVPAYGYNSAAQHTHGVVRPAPNVPRATSPNLAAQRSVPQQTTGYANRHDATQYPPQSYRRSYPSSARIIQREPQMTTYEQPQSNAPHYEYQQTINSRNPHPAVRYETHTKSVPEIVVADPAPAVRIENRVTPTSAVTRRSTEMPEPIPTPAISDSITIQPPVIDDGPQPTLAVRPKSTDDSE